MWTESSTSTSNNMPFPFLAAASAGSSLLGGLLQSNSSKKQHKRNVELWRENNAYNHPSAQMARLREAGLNPNLVYGSGVSGVTGQSSSPADTAPVEQNIGNPIGAYQQMKTTELQNDNLRQSNTLMAMDGINKTIDARIKQQQHLKNSVEISNMDELFKLQTDALRTDIRKKEGESYLNAIEGDILARIGDAKVDRYLTDLKNAKALGNLREVELRIKQEMEKFTSSNQAISLIAKLAQMIK